jgi:NADP-dependent 3-hydroxy acid dehydrogenase YdfG
LFAFGNTFRINSTSTLNFDVRDKETVLVDTKSLLKHCEVDILINNAGNAHGLDSIQNGNIG